MNPNHAASRRAASINPRNDLTSNAARDICGALTTLLADVFALASHRSPQPQLTFLF